MTAHVLRWLGVLILVVMAAYAAIQFNSKSWPSVQGEILRGGWASERSLGSARGEYQVRYSYNVGGKPYTGDEIGWAAVSSIVPVLNVREPRQPREGDKVLVYYAPWLPRVAVLVPGPLPTLGLWTIVSVILSIICFAFAKISTHPIF